MVFLVCPKSHTYFKLRKKKTQGANLHLRNSRNIFNYVNIIKAYFITESFLITSQLGVESVGKLCMERASKVQFNLVSQFR